MMVFPCFYNFCRFNQKKALSRFYAGKGFIQAIASLSYVGEFTRIMTAAAAIFLCSVLKLFIELIFSTIKKAIPAREWP